MRCVIARFPFDLIKSEVEHSMAGREPEPVTSASVVIGPHSYPVKQVGEVITKQDRRDFTELEVARASPVWASSATRSSPRPAQPSPAGPRPRNTPFGPAAPGLFRTGRTGAAEEGLLSPSSTGRRGRPSAPSSPRSPPSRSGPATSGP